MNVLTTDAEAVFKKYEVEVLDGGFIKVILSLTPQYKETSRLKRSIRNNKTDYNLINVN